MCAHVHEWLIDGAGVAAARGEAKPIRDHGELFTLLDALAEHLLDDVAQSRAEDHERDTAGGRLAPQLGKARPDLDVSVRHRLAGR